MTCLPQDVFFLITGYAFGMKIPHRRLMLDIERVQILRECIHDTFLTVSCFDRYSSEFIHNPYRSFSTYYPTLSIEPKTIISNSILCIAQTLRPSFFERVKSYRSIFLRFCIRFQQGNLFYFNKVLERYLIFIRHNDLTPYIKDSRITYFLQCFDLSQPIPVSLV
jgi:hypothetical protein